MTVSSQTSTVTFVGNGAATSFPLPFRFFNNSDIRAYFIDSTTGAATAMAIGVDYTLMGAGEPEVDGNALSLLTTTVPLASMRGLYVERVMPQVQETDIVNQGQFFASTHENVFDRLTMLIQQANANSAGAIRVAVGDPEPSRLAPAAQRANLLMGFDSSGNPIAVAPVSGSASDLAMNLANSSDPAKGASLVGYLGRTLAARLGEVVNIADMPNAVTGDNSPADRTRLIAKLDAAAAAGKPVIVPARVWEFSDWIPLPDKLKMIFMPGAQWKLTAGTALGGFVCGGYTQDLVPRPFTDAEIYGLDLDGTSIAGENGFNAINGVGIRLYNPKLRNFIHSPVSLGGRAFQFEGAIVDGIDIHDAFVENCSIGGNSQGDPSGGTEIARNINYFNPVMRNVDVPFNVDGQFANPQNGNLGNCSTNVFNFSGFNCGKLTFPGNTGFAGGGIFCGDRGFGLNVFGARVYNTTVYGGIGAIVRGTMFAGVMKDIRFEGASCTAVVDFTAPGFGVPSLADWPNRVTLEGMKYAGNLDNVIKTGGSAGRIGACRFDIEIDSAAATLTGVVDVAGITTATLNLSLRDQVFTSSGERLLSNIFSVGNTIGVCTRQSAEGVVTPVDNSGAALVFTAVSGYYYRTGKVVQGFMRVDVPATADASPFKLGGLPFPGLPLTEAGGATITYSSVAAADRARIIGGTSEIVLYSNTAAPVTNAQLSGTTLILDFKYLTA